MGFRRTGAVEPFIKCTAPYYSHMIYETEKREIHSTCIMGHIEQDSHNYSYIQNEKSSKFRKFVVAIICARIGDYLGRKLALYARKYNIMKAMKNQRSVSVFTFTVVWRKRIESTLSLRILHIK